MKKHWMPMAQPTWMVRLAIYRHSERVARIVVVVVVVVVVVMVVRQDSRLDLFVVFQVQV
jgi:hypothetical protein